MNAKEAASIQTTHYHIPGAPALAVLADIHEKLPEALLPSLREHRPQLILIPGDFVYGSIPQYGLKMEDTPLPSFFSECCSIAPTFISLGNHEWMLHSFDLDLIRATGAVVLDNTWTSAGGVRIGGLTSARVLEYRKDILEYTPSQLTRNPLYFRSPPKRGEKPQPETDWLRGFERQDGYKILLCHHPEYWPLLQSCDIDLVISGHAHGGQWRFYDPLIKRWRGVYAPGQGLFPMLTEGVTDSRLLISRGLSNTVRPIPRLFNRTELVYVNG